MKRGNAGTKIVLPDTLRHICSPDLGDGEMGRWGDGGRRAESGERRAKRVMRVRVRCVLEKMINFRFLRTIKSNFVYKP
jgi:hypothetical protein